MSPETEDEASINLSLTRGTVDANDTTVASAAGKRKIMKKPAENCRSPSRIHT